jgi:hypothetical protein
VSGIFGGRPLRLGASSASNSSMYAKAARQVAYSTRSLLTLCGWASFALRLVISSSVIARPFLVVRDGLLSTQKTRRAIP